MNKKGMSIVELIVCVVIMSIVMVFLYKLINDVFYEKNNGYFAKNNQEQRAEIINNVQYAIKDNNIYKVTYDNTHIYLYNGENLIKSITIDNNVTLETNDRKWTMKSSNLGNVSCTYQYGVPSGNTISIDANNRLMVECSIPVYTSNDNNSSSNNNRIDDLTFEIVNSPYTSSSSSSEEETTPETPTSKYLSDYVIGLYGTDTSVMTDTHYSSSNKTYYTNFRYTGTNPNNYVSFNGELWRIIGVFYKDSTGLDTKNVKIINTKSSIYKNWDDSSLYTNRNNWSTCSLNTYLNNTYYSGLSYTAKNQIADVTWYSVINYDFDGTYEDQSLTVLQFYDSEKVYGNSKNKIGLISVSDYGYSSDVTRGNIVLTDTGTIQDGTGQNVQNHEWIDSTQWTINSEVMDYTNDVSDVLEFSPYYLNSGIVGYTSPNTSKRVEPTLYLKYDIKYVSGSGTSSDPIIIG